MRKMAGETKPRSRAAWMGVAAGAALAFVVPAGGQQISYSVYGGVSFDGYESNIQIIGASVRPAGTGLRPMAGLQAYRLGFDAGGTQGSTDVLAVTPSVGAGYFTEAGQVNLMVGYAFVNEETNTFFGGGGGQNGLTTAVQGGYWGMDPDIEGVAAYSWEPDYLWTNLVIAQPVLFRESGTLSVGADGVWEGQMVDDGFRAFSVGPAVRWSNDRNFGVTVAGGYRDADGRDPTWYVRLGGAFYR